MFTDTVKEMEDSSQNADGKDVYLFKRKLKFIN